MALFGVEAGRFPCSSSFPILNRVVRLLLSVCGRDGLTHSNDPARMDTDPSNPDPLDLVERGAFLASALSFFVFACRAGIHVWSQAGIRSFSPTFVDPDPGFPHSFHRRASCEHAKALESADCLVHETVGHTGRTGDRRGTVRDMPGPDRGGAAGTSRS